MGKCIILLSEKSSGSSIVQKFVTKYTHAKLLPNTRHYENETLYWTKAASLLGLEQHDMVDSEVPLSREYGKSELIKLLRDNLPGYNPPEDEKELVHNGWSMLCKQYTPVLFEKSPHHLCQKAALDLICEQIERDKDNEYLIIGLIRNPMDTIYSQYDRWCSPPALVESQWLKAYTNLLELKKKLGNQMITVRYEDIAADNSTIQPIIKFCQDDIQIKYAQDIDNKSMSRWRNSKTYYHILSDETIQLASILGYDEEVISLKRSTYKKLLFSVVYPVRRAVYKKIKPLALKLGIKRKR
ncbi:MULTISPECIES: sulfotransferase [Thalassolituus]|uniref:sulfotransferase n=1 Tax=Thalassolituus TaxID=187492 RepID=UPI000C40F862|nr:MULTISPECIES: sulfotransferase [Thalassolituus]MAE35883.1 hypothetical protein [Oceanospirillaceae bacterium]|tara:strand:- start:9161 stop:10054 length:894 start_codon:yes stop_codon:yes gene_type:complete